MIFFLTKSYTMFPLTHHALATPTFFLQHAKIGLEAFALSGPSI